MIKRTGTAADGSTAEQRYYYSRWPVPDSIITYEVALLGKQVIQRRIFRYNEHSDPIEDLMLTGKDTDSYQENTYSYDP